MPFQCEIYHILPLLLIPSVAIPRREVDNINTVATTRKLFLIVFYIHIQFLSIHFNLVGAVLVSAQILV